MPFTGQLGSRLSQLGSIALGTATYGTPAFTGMPGEGAAQGGNLVPGFTEQPVTTGFTGLLGNPLSLLGQVQLNVGNPPPNQVYLGSAYATETYGQGPYGARGFDSQGPSLTFSQPLNSATGVAATEPLILQYTSPDELDAWSLSISIDGQPIIAASTFISPYGGSIVFNGQNVTISIGTHPALANGAHTVTTTINDLSGQTTTPSVSFTVSAGGNHYIVNVSDSITITDATGELIAHVVGVSDTVTITDATTPSLGVHDFLADSATISDSVASAHGNAVLVADSVTVSQTATEREDYHPSVSDTITVTDHATAGQVYDIGITDSVSVASALATHQTGQTHVVESVTISSAFNAGDHDHVQLSDAVNVIEHFTGHRHTALGITLTVTITESLSAGSTGISANDTRLSAGFLNSLRIDGITEILNYQLRVVEDGFPVTLIHATPTVTVLATGGTASVTNTTQTIGNVTFPVSVVSISGVNFHTLGAAYLNLVSPTNTETYLRIVQILSNNSVIVDRPLINDPLNGNILWQALSGVQGVIFQTTKFTNGGIYAISGTGLILLDGTPFTFEGTFSAMSPLPTVVDGETLSDGRILVTFSDNMLVDGPLLDPGEYSLSGPGSPYIESVTTAGPNQVLLFPRNVQGGSYALTVGTHTPHDFAGNPIDPFFNTVAFTTSPPIESRSVFTDFGPIARPPLTLETGTSVTFVDYQTVTIVGASISSTFVGFQLELTGTTHNDGSYLIVAVKTQNTVKVVASFNLPDAGGATATWAVVNPRDGEIADDPAHVTVTVNGFQVIPQEVVGLLGQIVLPTTPIHGDDVQVGYSWICNPTVEIRRLNSKEFRLNSWNRDLGYLPDEEHYRFNNVLPVTTNFKTPPPIQQGSRAAIVSPSQVYLPDGNALGDYAGLTLVLTAGLNAGAYDIVSVADPHHVNVSGGLNPADPLSGNIPWTIGDTSDIQAILPQPLLRDLKYRAYERAYTALLNDPNTLTLNAPTNLIAYPPLARIVAQTFVSYESSALPENDAVAPWLRVGNGTAAIVALQLIVTSPTSGTFPGGSPVYWTREVDQTFPHVFASTWDMQITSTPVTQGVFTGVAFGYSDDLKAIVFGYLIDGTTRKVGFLVKGAGNDPSLITAWTGGLDTSGNPTNAPLAVDWSILHSYRIYQDPAGNISLYLDGAVVPSLLVTEEQLPYLEELAAPFNALQGVFFGSLSAQAQSSSTWDFVRYLVLPLNPLQTAPSIFVDYVANVLPENAAKPWTPVGYHGTETILASAFLLLDSTSAVPAAEEGATGLVGGDFRGFFRLEPLIATNAEVVVDFNVQIRTWTQGFAPNALMVAIDDSDRLIQLSFISDTAAPKFSYGGDGFPTAATPPWTALGTQTAVMHGRTLQIIDTSATDGLVYVIDDTNPVSPFQNHYAQTESFVAGSSLTAVAGVLHQVTAAIVGGSDLQPDAFLNAGGVAHVGVAAITAGAGLTAQAVVQRGAVASIQATSMALSQPFVSPHSRVVSPDNSYILEARLQPLTFTADPTGFIGAMAEVFDSERTIGFSLLSVAGTYYVALQGEGTVVAQFAFNWNDGNLHTYRVVYAPAIPTGVVTMFVDGLMVGTPQNYSAFPTPVSPSSVGFVAFGSSTPGSQSISTVNWVYCNAWRVETGQKFVGVWRGTTTGTLIDFWVPTKATGSNALILGNALMDVSAQFVTAGVQTTDYLIVDVGPNAGVYQITGVTAQTLSIDAMWPSSPSKVNYRIAQQTDWTVQHSYRIAKAPSGDDVAVFLDSSQTPLIYLTYDDSILPPSQVGLPRVIAGTLPSVVWGAFDPTNLSQSSWQFFRYGVTRSPTELRIVPPHQVLNQRNVIQSYERHLSNLPHTLTDFWSESEGITPNTYPDFLTNPGLVAFTLLNEGTPLVPQTQTYEVQSPQPVVEFVGALNDIADVLNSSGSFLLNDATRRVGIIVPDDVLYSSLQIIERDTGQTALIAPFDDECQPTYGPINYQDEVCLVYDAQTLPENDPTAITPWSFYAHNPAHVMRSVFSGVLTYGTDATGTQTLYRNATPLPDAPSLGTQVQFRLKVLQDSSGGLGDSQVRFGFSAIGLTASLALVSEPTGQRYVLVVDQLSNQVLGGIPFDFYDGNYHTYRLVRDPGAGNVQIFVDS